MTVKLTQIAIGIGAAALAAPGIAAAQAPGGTTVRVDFDAFAMFVNAEPMVKAVMLILLAASFVSWTLCVVKLREFRSGLLAVKAATVRLASAKSLSDVDGLDPATARMAQAAVDEIAQSASLIQAGSIAGAGQRAEDRIARIEGDAVATMRRGLPVFASIGSVGPFVGLFGTVWGIMHSFTGIAAAKTTSLAVVAPGISEALLATALGLVAAIPATVIYNYLVRRLAVYRGALEMTATLVAGLAGREIEDMALAAGRKQAAFIPQARSA